MKENDILTITIIDDNHMGNGIAKKDDITIFVPKTAIGDIVQIKIEKVKKSIAEAKVIKIIERSIEYQEPKCPYYNECGGCDLLHISYEREKKLKENYIKRLFKDFDKKIISLDRGNYRNKVTLHVKNNNLGYFQKESNSLIKISHCLLLDNDINNLIKSLEKIDLSNITEIIIKKGEGLLLSVKGHIDDKDLKKIIKNKKIKSIYQNDKLIYGDDYLKIKIGNTTYNVNNNSFFQVNTKCATQLYDEIKEHIDNSNNLLDLYCGTGSIGIYLHEKANLITGIEINKDSVKCAKENIKQNNIKNYEIINSDASNIKGKYDTIVVDPPRSGLSKKVINILNKSNANGIIYVSCNPSTLKRDIELLDNYNLKDISIYNMFPATKHIETIVVLERE